MASGPRAMDDWRLGRETYIAHNSWRYGKGVRDARLILSREYDAIIEEALRAGHPVPLESRPEWAITLQQFAEREWGSDEASRRLIAEDMPNLQREYRELREQAIREGKPVPIGEGA